MMGRLTNSPRVIDARSRNDPRIVVIRQERLGLVPSLNRGLAVSRAQLVARLDADDIAKPQRLERQSQYLDNHPEIGLVGTWADKIDEQGSVKGALTPPTQSEELAALLTRTNPFVHSSVMMRKSVLQTVGFYRPAFQGAEDYDLWMRISEVTNIANLRGMSAAIPYSSRERVTYRWRAAAVLGAVGATGRTGTTHERVRPDLRTDYAAQLANSRIPELTDLRRPGGTVSSARLCRTL